MARRVLMALLLLSAASAAGVTDASATAGAPVLGAKSAFHGGKGFGTVKPKVVFLGGDPTGYVSKLAWQHWGQPRAVGYGQGWCPGKSVAAGHYCPAALHVSSLGTCHGRRAYQTLAFDFKDNGRWTAGSKLNACTGSFQR